MRHLYAADMPPLKLGDLARLVQPGIGLEEIVKIMLAAGVLEGWMGEAARGAVGEVLRQAHDAAAAAVVALLPPDVAALAVDEDGVDAVTRAGGRWLASDGMFAAVVPGREALIGTGDEVVAFMSKVALRAARSVAADPNAAPDRRYEAAAIARPKLRVVG